MAKFTVVEMEELTSKKGNKYKKLTIKEDGKDHLEPRTTMFGSHPEYANAVVGAVIGGTLKKEDSGTPIPAHPNKNYVNRTLLEEGAVVAQKSSGNLEATVASLVEWAKTKGYTGTGQPVNETPYTSQDDEGINPADIPF